MYKRELFLLIINFENIFKLSNLIQTKKDREKILCLNLLFYFLDISNNYISACSYAPHGDHDGDVHKQLHLKQDFLQGMFSIYLLFFHLLPV